MNGIKYTDYRLGKMYAISVTDNRLIVEITQSSWKTNKNGRKPNGNYRQGK